MGSSPIGATNTNMRLTKSTIRKIGRIKDRASDGFCTDTSTPSINEIKRLVKKLKSHFKKNKRPDFFAASGYSGCAIGTALSYEFDIPLILLRNSHPARHKARGDIKIQRELCINGYVEFKKNQTYIFVDDLIESGITFARMFYALTEKRGMKCVGVALTDEYTYGLVCITHLFKDEKIESIPKISPSP